KNFLDCRRVELVILDEKVASPFRYVTEKLNLLFHNRQHRAQIICVGDIDISLLQERSGKFDDTIERHLGDVLAVQPKTFIEVERGIAPVDFLQLKKLPDFSDIDFFAMVFGRPAEQAK